MKDKIYKQDRCFENATHFKDILKVLRILKFTYLLGKPQTQNLRFSKQKTITTEIKSLNLI